MPDSPSACSTAPEIGKIAAYAKNERITKADIDAVAAPVLEAQVFEMTNAVSKGNFDRAAGVLGTLLKWQEEPLCSSNFTAWACLSKAAYSFL